MQSQDFWDRVHACAHTDEDRSKTHSKLLRCPTPGCSGSESRCLACGVYISRCGCGYLDGMDGWPDSKRSKGLRPYRSGSR